jgi:hypothetical protein
MRRDGYVKLLDFGLARPVASEPTCTRPIPASCAARCSTCRPSSCAAWCSTPQRRGTGVLRAELAADDAVRWRGSSDVAAAILRSEPPLLLLRDGTPAPPRLPRFCTAR